MHEKQLFKGLCDTVRDYSPRWYEGIGHEWTSPVITHFVRSAPDGLRAWLEVPIDIGRPRKRKLDLVWARMFPEDGHKQLAMALESQWAKWDARDLRVWREAHAVDIEKLKSANADLRVLVRTRQRDPEEALDCLRVEGRELQGKALFVLLCPSQVSGSCIARGLVFPGEIELGPTPC